MRVNIYVGEMTDRLEIISKEINGHTFTGLRFYLELPVTVDGKQYQAPFMHRPGDDDSGVVTFWGRRDLRAVLLNALATPDKHYGTANSVDADREDWQRAKVEEQLAGAKGDRYSTLGRVIDRLECILASKHPGCGPDKDIPPPVKISNLDLLHCRFGCADEPVGVYWLPTGCACWLDQIQALCAQHVTKAEPISGMYAILERV